MLLCLPSLSVYNSRSVLVNPIKLAIVFATLFIRNRISLLTKRCIYDDDRPLNSPATGKFESKWLSLRHFVLTQSKESSPSFYEVYDDPFYQLNGVQTSGQGFKTIKSKLGRLITSKYGHSRMVLRLSHTVAKKIAVPRHT